MQVFRSLLWLINLYIESRISSLEFCISYFESRMSLLGFHIRISCFSHLLHYWLPLFFKNRFYLRRWYEWDTSWSRAVVCYIVFFFEFWNYINQIDILIFLLLRVKLDCSNTVQNSCSIFLLSLCDFIAIHFVTAITGLIVNKQVTSGPSWTLVLSF